MFVDWNACITSIKVCFDSKNTNENKRNPHFLENLRCIFDGIIAESQIRGKLIFMLGFEE